MRNPFTRRPETLSFSKDVIAALKTAPDPLVPNLNNDIASASTSWGEFLIRFQKSLSTEDIHNFLQWSVVKNTMFFENSSVAKFELLEILKNSENPSYWLSALTESPVGNPDLMLEMPTTSCNRIHKLHHLWKFEHETGTPLRSFDNFIEIGAGYGLLPALSKALGLTGSWTLIDFEIMHALQKWYLDSNAIGNAQFLTPTQVTQSVLTKARSLVISTWALSEMSVGQREHYLECIQGSSLLLAFHGGSFDEVDNTLWFSQLVTQDRTRTWSKVAVPGLEDQWYLFGVKN